MNTPRERLAQSSSPAWPAPMSASPAASPGAPVRPSGDGPHPDEVPTLAPGDLDGERRAALALSSLQDVGAATLRALRSSFQSLRAALDAPRREVVPFLRSPQARERFLAVPDFDALTDALVQRLERSRVRLLLPQTDAWPRRLRSLAAWPLLYVRGRLGEKAPSLAVVGARTTDSYGTEITRFWAGEAARRGIAIVSGGALGVDCQAHEAALAAGGATVAVLGTGIDQRYPAANAPLFERILQEGGALVSQFPLGTPPLRQNFILRNPLIAALADATLVTRAGPQSGALSTAKAAHELGRPVFILPGELSQELSWGGQALAEAGQARCIFGLGPIGKALGVAGPWPSYAARGVSPPAAPSTASPPGHARPRRQAPMARRPSPHGLAPPVRSPLPAARPLPPLEEKILNVFNGLQEDLRQFDELLAQSDLDAAGLAEALLRLELLGLCEELPGRFFRRSSPRQVP